MNPMLSEALASIVRSILKLGAGYLVARNVWSQGDATTYVGAAALAVVGFAWSYWTTYMSRVKLLTALTMPVGATENGVMAKVDTMVTPSVTTPPNTVPGVPKLVILLLACALAMSTACAALHRPDGTVNTSAILADARWGVMQACDALWLSTEQCAFAENLLSLADSIAAPNLTGSEVAVRGLIVEWEAKLPLESRLRPYLDAMITLLPS